MTLPINNDGFLSSNYAACFPVYLLAIMRILFLPVRRLLQVLDKSLSFREDQTHTWLTKNVHSELVLDLSNAFLASTEANIQLLCSSL